MKDCHLEAIDVGRGLAALCVTIYHYKLGYALATFPGLAWLRFIDLPGSTIAVPFFFFLSGFCIHLANSGKNIGKGFASRFFIQRFFRIYPTWFFAVCFSVLAAAVLGYRIDVAQIASHLTLTNSLFHHEALNVALWSVSVEAALYCLYPLWLYFRKSFGLFAAVGLAGVISALSCLTSNELFPTPTGRELWFFLNVWIGWVAGAAFAECWNRRKDLLLARPLWWHLGIGYAFLTFIIFEITYIAPILRYLEIPLLIVLSAWLLCILLRLGNIISSFGVPGFAKTMWRLLANIGTFSYSLYLLHFPLQQLRFPLHEAMTGYPIFQYFLYVVWFFGILFCAKLAYMYLERPFISVGKRLLARRNCAALS